MMHCQMHTLLESKSVKIYRNSQKKVFICPLPCDIIEL